MTRRYRVEGRVQGVGYRYFTQRQAVRLGLVGWVRNADDGSVEVLATGDAAPLAEFEAALRRGPGSAMVTSLLVKENPDEVDSEASFKIV